MINFCIELFKKTCPNNIRIETIQLVYILSLYLPLVEISIPMLANISYHSLSITKGYGWTPYYKPHPKSSNEVAYLVESTICDKTAA